MKKLILNLGKTLNKLEQKQINGGRKFCESHEDCGTGCCNTSRFCQIFGVPWAWRSFMRRKLIFLKDFIKQVTFIQYIDYEQIIKLDF